MLPRFGTGKELLHEDDHQPGRRRALPGLAADLPPIRRVQVHPPSYLAMGTEHFPELFKVLCAHVGIIEYILLPCQAGIFLSLKNVFRPIKAEGGLVTCQYMILWSLKERALNVWPK